MNLLNVIISQMGKSKIIAQISKMLGQKFSIYFSPKFSNHFLILKYLVIMKNK